VRRTILATAWALTAALGAATFARAQARLILPFDAPFAGAAAPIASGLRLGAVPPTLAPALAAPASFAAAFPALSAAPAATAPLFSGAYAAAPGAESSVYPRVIDPSAAPHPEFAAQQASARGVVREALASLRESVARGGWTGPDTALEDSCCGDAAPKLAVLLRGRGLPARLVEAEFHYYVLLDLPGGQIVIDPTVRQFFRRAPESVPPVFVGTITQLKALFASRSAEKTTRYAPDRIYFSDARDREAALAALDRKVRSGSSDEHAPLRRFLAAPARAERAAPSILLN
jgi:hypothetical protein